MATFVEPANMTRIIEVCREIPGSVKSNGFLWKKDIGETVSYPLSMLQLQLALIFVTTQLVYFLLKCCGLRNVLASQMIAGIILGPSVLGKMMSNYDTYMFPYSSQQVLAVLNTFGYVLFCFMIGIKMNPGIVLACGRKALYTSLPSVVVPFVVSLVSQRFLASYFDVNGLDNLELIFTATIYSMSTFPVISLLISDLKLISTDLGRLALSSALVTDSIGAALSICNMVFSVAMESGFKHASKDLGLNIGVLVGVLFVARPFMFWIIRRTPEGKPVKNVYIFAIFLIAMGSGLITHMSKASMTFGPFLMGLAMPNGPPLGSTLVNKFDFFGRKILLPSFVTTCVMRANIHDIKFKTKLSKAHAITVVIIIFTKFMAALIPSLCFKLPGSDASALALLMSAKGVVELALFSLHRDKANSSFQEGFSFVILVILFTALAVPILVNHLYDPLRKYASYEHRNVIHLKPKSELKVLLIVHNSANISSQLRLLQLLSPSKQTPISLYVLHLIEMVGRALPIFISHQIQTITHSSYSDHVLTTFRNFQKDSHQGVNVHVFTAISPHKYMHDDVWTLALDKSTHFIIFPFHRRCSIDGLILSDDMFTRNLNCTVLKQAPCSVGIFVNRFIPTGRNLNSVASSSSTSQQSLSGSSIQRVAVVFLGGNDDREALALAKHMVKDSSSNIHLTVLYFVAGEYDIEHIEWDKMADREAIREIKYENEDVNIVQENVKGGHDTAARLLAIANDYDLFLVGRRHKKQDTQLDGLNEWSEFPELGPVGDLLCSMDFRSGASVLVVHQQNMSDKNAEKMD